MKIHFLKPGGLTITLLIISALALLTFSSCDKEDKDNNETEINDNYYVKYIITGNGAYGRFSNWTANTPQGTYTNSGLQVRSWNQTYGPVNRGFRCKVEIGDYISGPPTIEIHISKNDEPFALKAIETGNSASYTINY